MYVPAEDTLFLIKCAEQYSGRWALEIGVGSGAVAQSLLPNFDNVVATDIDLASLAYCKGKGIRLVCCDAAAALYNVRFDLVVSNPPYLPGDPRNDLTVFGGNIGVETTIHFIESAISLLNENGQMLVILSSLADDAPFEKFLLDRKLKKRIVAEKALFYERLYAVEITF